MNIELTDEEKIIVHNALETYLSNLREEIVKSEKHEWKVGLHNEQDILKKIIERLT